MEINISLYSWKRKKVKEKKGFLSRPLTPTFKILLENNNNNNNLLYVLINFEDDKTKTLINE